MNSIELRKVTKKFGDFVAVNELSFEVAQGSIMGLLGPNGAGKTSTIRMIVNIFLPDSGDIFLMGQPVSHALQKRVGYLPEERGIYKNRKIGEQLIFFSRLKGVAKEDAARSVDKWLARMELSEWKNHYPTELSKGMHQKIQFIAAILHDPEVLILDEPFTGLDPISVSMMKDVIFEFKQAGKTIIFSTHQMEQVEQICDAICLIKRGTKRLGGNLKEIKRNYGQKTVSMEFSGSDAFLYNGLAAQVIKHPNHFEIAHYDVSEGQEVLRQAVLSGAVIQRFQVIEPSLNDIFIEIIGDKDNGNTGNVDRD
jgi:ABC-2 type transport system ATP-binding protein